MALTINNDGNFVLQSAVIQSLFDGDIAELHLDYKINCCTSLSKEIVVADITEGEEDSVIITPEYLSVDAFTNTFYTFTLRGLDEDNNRTLASYCMVYTSSADCNDIARAVAEYTARHLGHTDLHCQYMLLLEASACTCVQIDGSNTCDSLCILWKSITNKLSNDYEPDTMPAFSSPCTG